MKDKNPPHHKEGFPRRQRGSWRAYAGRIVAGRKLCATVGAVGQFSLYLRSHERWIRLLLQSTNILQQGTWQSGTDIGPPGGRTHPNLMLEILIFT